MTAAQIFKMLKPFASRSGVFKVLKRFRDTGSYLPKVRSMPPYPVRTPKFIHSRYKRICSDEKELNVQLTTLKNAFTALRYKPKTVKNQIIKAMSIP